MRVLFALTMIVFCSGLTNAQQHTVWQLEKSIPGNWRSVYVDNSNNYYLLSETDQLKKFTSKGDSVAVYNDLRRHGSIALVDVANPLRILIYHAEFLTVVWVDRFLRPVHTLDLREAGVSLSKAVASSFDGKVWVYDELERRLKKIGLKGELLQQTPDLRQVLGEDVSFNAMQEGQQKIYCYDALRGFYVFDYFGNFERKIELKGWTKWQLQGVNFIGQKDKNWFSYNLKTGDINQIDTTHE